jgi:hypothetical protein
MATRMTNVEAIRMECETTDPSVRFTLNWARCQYGNATARLVATLIKAGHEVSPAPHGASGWIVNGTHRKHSVDLTHILAR